MSTIPYCNDCLFAMFSNRGEMFSTRVVEMFYTRVEKEEKIKNNTEICLSSYKSRVSCISHPVRPIVHPHIISFDKKFAEVGLTHELCPIRQNHVIIHSKLSPESSSGWTTHRRHIGVGHAVHVQKYIVQY
jgi:hypothetical protein